MHLFSVNQLMNWDPSTAPGPGPELNRAQGMICLIRLGLFELTQVSGLCECDTSES